MQLLAAWSVPYGSSQYGSLLLQSHQEREGLLTRWIAALCNVTMNTTTYIYIYIPLPLPNSSSKKHVTGLIHMQEEIAQGLKPGGGGCKGNPRGCPSQSTFLSPMISVPFTRKIHLLPPTFPPRTSCHYGICSKSRISSSKSGPGMDEPSWV